MKSKYKIVYSVAKVWHDSIPGRKVLLPLIYNICRCNFGYMVYVRLSTHKYLRIVINCEVLGVLEFI